MTDLKIPLNFLDSEAARKFVIALRGVNADKERAGYYMLKMWLDYAANGSNHREIGSDDYASDPACQILEEACGWFGQAGKMIEFAVAAGLMVVTDPPEGLAPTLQLMGFYPLNAPCKTGSGAQRRGAMKSAVVKNAKGAEQDTTQLFDLWSQTTIPHKDIPGATRKGAVHMVLMLCRCLKVEAPTANVWANEIFLPLAVSVREDHGDEEIDKVCRYLVANRDSPEIPGRIDLILQKFGTLVEKADREGS